MSLIPYPLVAWAVLGILATVAAYAVPDLRRHRRAVCRIAFWSTFGYAAANTLFFAAIAVTALVNVPGALSLPWRLALTAGAALCYVPMCLAGLLLGGAFGLRLARRATIPA